jgi:predicted kinase
MQKLIVLVGCSGSGKTVYSTNLGNKHKDWVIIHSDDYRIDNGYRRHHIPDRIKSFKGIDDYIIECLKSGKTVVYDACNLTKFKRALLLKRVKALHKNIDITAIYFKIDTLTCIRQDKSPLRNHKVGMFCIIGMKLLQRLNRPRFREGFNRIVLKK